MNNVDWFIKDCEAIILLYRTGHLSREHVKTRIDMAAKNHGVE